MHMHKQKGFTLIELMIGLTIGMVLIVGAGGVFMTTLAANVNMTKQQQFEQTTEVLSSFISAEMRRAGYSNAPSLSNPGAPVVLTPQANGAHFFTSPGCVLLSHSTPTQDEVFYGYKVKDQVIYQYTSTTANGACGADVSGWTALTNTRDVLITGLTFAGTSPVTVTLAAQAVGLTTRTLLATTAAVARTIVLDVTPRNI